MHKKIKRPMKRPLVLDFDGSLHALAEAEVLSLAAWQEAVRFGCGLATWRKLRKALDEKLPNEYGTVLMGSGDFHHLSHLLIERIDKVKLIDVVVLDNHPDNMRFPFGIHCGSWVHHVAALPNVRTVHVVGISSGDAGWCHAWENTLQPLYANRVHYWTLGVDTRWAHLIGLSRSISSFLRRETLIESFVAYLRGSDLPVYLSIDKDVLDAGVVKTNWDQGRFVVNDIEQIVSALAGRIVGSDITGDISLHSYSTRWKRWLSAMDNQPVLAASEVAQWQSGQVAVNRRLLAAIAVAAATGS